MPFNGDDFICFKYFKQVVESSNNVSRSTHLHVTQMDQNIKRTLLKPSMSQHLCQIRPSRTLLGELIPSPATFFISIPYCFGVDNYCFLSLS